VSYQYLSGPGDDAAAAAAAKAASSAQSAGLAYGTEFNRKRYATLPMAPYPPGGAPDFVSSGAAAAAQKALEAARAKAATSGLGATDAPAGSGMVQSLVDFMGPARFVDSGGKIRLDWRFYLVAAAAATGGYLLYKKKHHRAR
jgi:hypothetical protein